MANLTGVNPYAGFTPLPVVYELSISKNRSGDRLGIIAAIARGQCILSARWYSTFLTESFGSNCKEITRQDRSNHLPCLFDAVVLEAFQFGVIPYWLQRL